MNANICLTAPISFPSVGPQSLSVWRVSVLVSVMAVSDPIALYFVSPLCKVPTVAGIPCLNEDRGGRGKLRSVICRTSKGVCKSVHRMHSVLFI